VGCAVLFGAAAWVFAAEAEAFDGAVVSVVVVFAGLFVAAAVVGTLG
jgi:hypothetical protein